MKVMALPNSETVAEVSPAEPTLVTIVLLSCDRPDWCAISLASAVHQTERAKVLVCDDSASDAVHDLANEYGELVEYVRGPRQGQLANLLHALTLVSTRWTLILHDDDVLEPVCVERLLGIMSADEGASIAIGDSGSIDASGSQLNLQVASASSRESLFVHGPNRMSFNERSEALLVRGAVSPFLATLLPTDLMVGWKPDARVGSVLDLALCETIVKSIETIWYVPEELIQYRIHGGSIASNFADLGPLLYILDRQLADPTFQSIWPLLRSRREDAIVRQARVWTGTGRWREGRALLVRHRVELRPRSFLPSATVTLPMVRLLYGVYIRHRNQRLNAK